MRRMIANQSRHIWSWVLGIMLFVCLVLLTMDYKLPDHAENMPMNSFLWTWDAVTPFHPTQYSTNPEEDFRCSMNDSLQDIPENIPKLHRDFLMYKHCRRFRPLLTPRPCEEDLFLLLAIKSTAVQVDRRASLRSTWGQEGLVKGRKVKLVFLVARSEDKVQSYPLQSLLKLESRQFGDILQWDFVDNFFNLTLKEVHFLRWFSRECRSAEFVLKGDDDVFVHTANVVEYLQDYNASEHLFAGDIIYSAYPIRNSKVKYFIPKEMYPDRPYPPYAGGGGYLMSRSTVISLDEVAADIDLFPIDDVFVGMCLQNMGLQLTYHRGFMTFGFRRIVSHFNPCIYRDIMLVHKLSPTEMWVMWSLLQDSSLSKSCSRNTKL